MMTTSWCHRVGQRGHPAGHRTVIDEVVGSHRIGSSGGFQRSSTLTTAAEGPSFSDAPALLLGPGDAGPNEYETFVT